MLFPGLQPVKQVVPRPIQVAEAGATIPVKNRLYLLDNNTNINLLIGSITSLSAISLLQPLWQPTPCRLLRTLLTAWSSTSIFVEPSVGLSPWQSNSPYNLLINLRDQQLIATTIYPTSKGFIAPTTVHSVSVVGLADTPRGDLGLRYHYLMQEFDELMLVDESADLPDLPAHLQIHTTRLLLLVAMEEFKLFMAQVNSRSSSCKWENPRRIIL